jgi:hypothetical protein
MQMRVDKARQQQAAIERNVLDGALARVPGVSKAPVTDADVSVLAIGQVQAGEHQAAIHERGRGHRSMKSIARELRCPLLPSQSCVKGKSGVMASMI